MSDIKLSVLMVAGRRRERAQRVLDGLDAQTCRSRLEVVVVDIAPDTPTALRIPDGIPGQIVSLSPEHSWGEARAAAFQQSSAPWVAYIEDHCYPSEGWAEALLEAHEKPWAAIGYAFTNANPETYISRASLMYDYGLWISPASGGAQRLLSYNNVSYKRGPLESLGTDLASSLNSDFHIHEEFERQGLELGVASKAIAAHENFSRLGGILQANHHYCRVLAAQRVESGHWGWPRRLVYGLTTPVGAPVIALQRLLASLRRRSSLWAEFLVTLPVVSLISLWTACGEALGYLFGEGRSADALSYWEVDAKRNMGS